MKRYRLIKLYPGSPDLGTEVQQKLNGQSFFYRNGDMSLSVLTEHIEEYPEYWEKVNDNIWYLVSVRDYQTGHSLFQAWYVHRVESFEPVNKEPLNYFKTKEEAEQYIIKNKPCLTLNDVGLILGGLEKKRDVFLELKRIVKSKL
jgi:hypothetical protein